MVEDLTNAFGPSGFEEEVVQAVKKHSGSLYLEHDAMHNVYAYMDEAAKKTVYATGRQKAAGSDVRRPL